MIGTFNDINESRDSDILAKNISKEIDKINDSLSYTEFAVAVAKVLKDEYGEHLYKNFIEELEKNLK